MWEGEQTRGVTKGPCRDERNETKRVAGLGARCSGPLNNPLPPSCCGSGKVGIGYIAKGPVGPNQLPPVFVAFSLGCLGTAAALTYGLYCFHRGQSHRSQLMMRTRIAAQGFTVVAILLGLAASTMKSRS